MGYSSAKSRRSKGKRRCRSRIKRGRSFRKSGGFGKTLKRFGNYVSGKFRPRNDEEKTMNRSLLTDQIRSDSQVLSNSGKPEYILSGKQEIITPSVVRPGGKFKIRDDDPNMIQFDDDNDIEDNVDINQDDAIALRVKEEYEAREKIKIDAQRKQANIENKPFNYVPYQNLLHDQITTKQYYYAILPYDKVFRATTSNYLRAKEYKPLNNSEKLARTVFRDFKVFFDPDIPGVAAGPKRATVVNYLNDFVIVKIELRVKGIPYDRLLNPKWFKGKKGSDDPGPQFGPYTSKFERTYIPKMYRTASNLIGSTRKVVSGHAKGLRNLIGRRLSRSRNPNYTPEQQQIINQQIGAINDAFNVEDNNKVVDQVPLGDLLNNSELPVDSAASSAVQNGIIFPKGHF
jgi:hypothetical protein